jgi:hypothetical protein
LMPYKLTPDNLQAKSFMALIIQAERLHNAPF